VPTLPPTTLIATPGNEQVSIAFIPSASAGVNGYTATSSPGGFTAPAPPARSSSLA